MKPEHLIKQKLTNLFHSGFLLGSMGLLIGLLGWIIYGVSGLLVAIFTGTIILALAPRISARMLLRANGAREIDVHSIPDLYRILLKLARRARLKSAPRLYYLPSDAMTAFTVGGRDEPSIAVTAGLLQELSFRELTGVLAHEVSHIRNNDTGILMLAGVLNQVTRLLSMIGLFLLFLYLPDFLAGNAGLNIFLPLLLLCAPTASTLLWLALSRTREFAADLEAARLTEDPLGLASALERLEQGSRGFPWHVLFPAPEVPGLKLLLTHPPTKARVRRLLELKGSPPTEPRGACGTLDPLVLNLHLNRAAVR